MTNKGFYVLRIFHDKNFTFLSTYLLSEIFFPSAHFKLKKNVSNISKTVQHGQTTYGYFFREFKNAKICSVFY